MAFKELCFKIFVLYIISFIAAAAKANDDSTREHGILQNSTLESNNSNFISRRGLESNNSSGNTYQNDTTKSLDDGNGLKEAYALYYIMPEGCTGFTASLTVYNPTVKNGQMCKSYISIQNTFNQPSDGTDEIAAGWMVDPWRYDDNRTRFFTFFRGAGGRSCTNLCRNGFKVVPGSYVAPGDVIDANNHITIKFMKDNNTGDWGLFIGPGVDDTNLSQIGYFPKYLFTGLADNGTYAEFGGAVQFIISLKSPPMGNGIYAKELPTQGDPLPAVMTNVYYIRPDGRYFDGHNRKLSYPNCYGLGTLMIEDDHFGYGGPGGCT